MARKKKKSTSKAKSSNVIKIPFNKEEEGGGGGIRLPEDDYPAELVKVKQGRSSEKDTPGVFVTFKISEGKHKGKKISDRLWITPKSLWRIRSLLESMGLNVPKKVVAVPFGKLVGKEVGITVADDDPYQGRIRSKIVDFVDLDTLHEADEEDEDEEDEDLEDDDEVEEDDAEEEDEDEEDEEDDDEDEDEEDEDEDEDLDELDLDEL